MKNRLPTFDAFEGVLFGVTLGLLALTWQYGLDFPLIHPGNYVGFSGIYGIPIIHALFYTLIVTVLYEGVVGRDAIQAIAYAVLGYFYLDSLVQLKYAVTLYYPQGLYGDTSLLNTVINFVGNGDCLCLIMLVMGLVLYHVGMRQPFPFRLNLLLAAFMGFGASWYLVFITTPLSIFLPLFLYLLSRKRRNHV